MCDCSQLPFPADSPDHHRVVWGVLSSINLAIVTDLFRAEVRAVLWVYPNGLCRKPDRGIPVGLFWPTILDGVAPSG